MRPSTPSTTVPWLAPETEMTVAPAFSKASSASGSKTTGRGPSACRASPLPSVTGVTVSATLPACDSAPSSRLSVSVSAP